MLAVLNVHLLINISDRLLGTRKRKYIMHCSERYLGAYPTLALALATNETSKPSTARATTKLESKHKMTSSEQRIVLVTGCSQGLGFHCVSSLASEGNIVVLLACRNVDNARTAATTIAQTTKCAPEHLVVLDQPLDLANNESVRLYAKAVRTWLGDRTLHSLVNNAGVGGLPEHRKNSAGHDHIFASNHLGHFLLTLLLLPVINGTGRIVNVSSEVHDPDTKTPLPDPQVQWPRSSEDYDTRLCAGEPLDGESARTSGGRRYTRSKLCNVLFTNELALRLSGATPFGTSEEVAAAALARKEKLSCRLPQARSIRVVAMNPGLMLDTGVCPVYQPLILAGFDAIDSCWLLSLYFFILPVF